MRVLFRVGAWIWFITGAGHLTLDLLDRLQPESVATASLNAVLRAHPFELFGIRRTEWDIYTGFSIAIGIFNMIIGLLFVLVDRIVEDPDRRRPVTLLGAVASLACCALSAVFLPTPPIVNYGLATLAFTGALFTAGRQRQRR
ncbi:hypothetical protein [Nonomuraea sp. NPDC050310]|uniref:LIC_13387 family protein n=1 Tax=Nonomuraea sp. NPDC050310 TaxID=3154935 RepID=UPI003409ADB2